MKLNKVVYFAKNFCSVCQNLKKRREVTVDYLELYPWGVQVVQARLALRGGGTR
jgi:hypothetical protein